MTDHDIETLVRQAVAEEASQAVDASTVLAGLQRGRRPRRRPIALIAAAGLAVAAVAVAVVVPTLATQDAPPSTQVAAPAPVVGQNILLIGLDNDVHTDSVVLARLGADGALSAISLPRDLLADIPGQGPGRLNSAYASAHQAAMEQGRDENAAAAAGAERLVQTVEGLSGVEIDHYASVDMAGFDRISTAVGGVEVCLNAASKNDVTGDRFPAGKQTLSGEQALAFLRQRHGLLKGDLDRVVRQQAFLKSLVAKVVGDPKKLASVVASVREHIKVDQGWDLVAFAGSLTAGVSLRTATLPVIDEPIAIPGGGGVAMGPDPSARTFVRDFLAGPAAGSSTSASPAPSSGTAETSCVN